MTETCDLRAIAARRAKPIYGQDYQELHQVAQIAAWRARPGTKGAAAARDIQDHIRRETKSRRTKLIPPGALDWQERDTAPSADQLAAEQVVSRAMDVLPLRYRRVIEARFWSGCSLVEIGERFGYGESRAHQIVKDSLRRMREALAT
jgi:RNA polymerase sigma factor (sigma-70 family)